MSAQQWQLLNQGTERLPPQIGQQPKPRLTCAKHVACKLGDSPQLLTPGFGKKYFSINRQVLCQKVFQTLKRDLNGRKSFLSGTLMPHANVV